MAELWYSRAIVGQPWWPPGGTTEGPVLGDPAPLPTESLEGTRIQVWTDPAIINAAGESWSLSPVAGGQVVINGLNDETTAAIVLILYHNHYVYIKDVVGLWWLRQNANGFWVETVDPAGPPQHAESAHGTVMASPTATPIWNATGDKFTFSPVGGRIFVNDIVDLTSSGVGLLAYYNHQVYYRNLSGLWFVRPSTTSAWLPATDPNPPPAIIQLSGVARIGGLTVTGRINQVGAAGIGRTTIGPVRALGVVSNPVVGAGLASMGPLRAIGGLSAQAAGTGIGRIGPMRAVAALRFWESVQGALYNELTDPPIVDQIGTAYTLTELGGRVVINGVIDVGTISIIQIFYWNRQVYIKNNQTPALWYFKSTAGSAWALTADPNPPIGPQVTHVTVQARIAAALAALATIRTNVALLRAGQTSSTGLLGRSQLGPVRALASASVAQPAITRVTAPLVGTVTTGTWQRGRIAGQDYSWLLPAQYDASKAYPCLFFLHWNGLAYEWYANGVDSVVRDEGGYWANVNFRRNYPSFVLMPYCDQRADTQGGGEINWGGYTRADQFSEGANMALLEDFMARYPIDRTRIYVTGTSLGGHGSWGHMIKYGARAGSKTTKRYFTAAMPCDGWSIEFFPSDNVLKEQLRNDPIWCYAGDGDGSAEPYCSQWYQAYGGTGTPTGTKTPTAQLRYTRVSGGHGAGWGTAYNFGTNGNANFNWLFGEIYGTLGQLPTQPNESAEGTSVITVGPAVVNAARDSFTLTSGAQVAVNSVVDGTTANATRLYYFNHTVYHQNAAGDWYSKALAGDPWAGPVAAPVVPPVIPGGYREPWEQPGSNASVWNTPIGSGVQWSTETDNDTLEIRRANGWVNSNEFSQACYISDTPNPIETFHTSNAEQTSPNTIFNVRMPPGWIITPGADAHVSVHDKTQARYFYGFYNVTQGSGRWEATHGERTDAYGTMEDQETGDYGANAGIGVIRKYDLDRGRIEHTLRFAIDKSQMRVAPGGAWRTNVPWPESTIDYGCLDPNDFNYYTGQYFIAGSTIGIPKSTAMPTGLSAGGIMLFKACQEFGCINRDQGGGGVIWYVETAMQNHPLIIGMQNDAGRIKNLLRVMRNQGRLTKNGGGTFLSAAPPPINPAYGP